MDGIFLIRGAPPITVSPAAVRRSARASGATSFLKPAFAARAVRESTSHGLKPSRELNMSLGGAVATQDDDFLASTIDQLARASDVTFSISAGNDSPGASTMDSPGIGETSRRGPHHRRALQRASPRSERRSRAIPHGAAIWQLGQESANDSPFVQIGTVHRVMGAVVNCAAILNWRVEMQPDLLSFMWRHGRAIQKPPGGRRFP